MSFVALIGCDGSGKSAVISQVAERLRAEGVKVACGHWRPKAFSKGIREGIPVVADNPHSRPPQGYVLSILKLGWLWLNWWVGWWGGLRNASSEGIVLFDRFHGDLLVDPLRYRYGGPLWLAEIVARLMPQPDMVLFLDASPEVLLSRKQEVSLAMLAQSRQRYLEIKSGYPRFVTIDVNQPLVCVVEQVLESIKGTQ